jgi:outer membrane translocation and assembly module TamA
MRSKQEAFKCIICICLALGLAVAGTAQNAPASKYPTQLPYAFSNFVWWSDSALRTELQKSLPDLGDEIAPTSTAEGRVREALKSLLKEKGIIAEVQTEDPSPFSLTAQRVPGAPEPAIVFRVLSPDILVDKVVLSGVPDSLMAKLHSDLQRKEGRDYSARQDWQVHLTVSDLLEASGYLDTESDVSHDAPRRTDDHYFVNLLVAVRAGQRYRISAISADGGLLLNDRDLSPLFTAKPGDIAGPNPLGRLGAQVRLLYWQRGYADVSIDASPVLDREHGLVAYHLQVTPGPLYHLRTLTIHKLPPEQQEQVKQMLGMSAGDVFDENLVGALYGKLSSNSSMAAYAFTFSPRKSQEDSAVDLTLDFYKKSDRATVTIK